MEKGKKETRWPIMRLLNMYINKEREEMENRCYSEINEKETIAKNAAIKIMNNNKREI